MIHSEASKAKMFSSNCPSPIMKKKESNLSRSFIIDEFIFVHKPLYRIQKGLGRL
jgi:hypothetical protein